MRLKLFFCALLALIVALPLFAEGTSAGTFSGLKNTVVLVIRHAEKPETGRGLTADGEARARAYVDYFKNFTVEGQASPPNYLFAAADSKESHRPILTLEPISHALGLPIDSQFKDKQFQELADEIESHAHGRVILICWHHGKIPQLLRALGADPGKLLPDGKWPDGAFGTLIQLRYDAQGQLTESKRLNENLLPDDTEKPSPALSGVR